MMTRSTRVRFAVAAVAVIALRATGCGQSPLAQIPNASVQFVSPAAGSAVRDDQTLSVQYIIKTDHTLTARLEIDRDETAGNGNETVLSSETEYAAPGGDGKMDFVAGELPYGTYFLRVVLSDGIHSAGFSPDGPIHIVPFVENGSTGNQDGLAALSEVEGLRLLHTNGMPGKVNSRVPFVSTWSTVDVKDNLSPIYISPIRIDKAVTLRRMQFYTYSRHPEARAKRLEIYAGTDFGSSGTLIRRMNLSMTSNEGGWNMATVYPPITLAPGQYGISFHGEEECSENWAANASGGPGFAMMSPVQGAPFAPVTDLQLGFSPNFTMRIIGNFVDEGDGPLPTSRAVTRVELPGSPPPIDTYPIDGDKPGKTACDEGEDELGASTPIHVTWQIVR